MSLLMKFPVVNLMAVLVRIGVRPPAGRDVLRWIVQVDAVRQLCVRLVR